MSATQGDLIAAALRGKEEAWTELQCEYREPLIRFCQRFCVEGTEAADAAQETFLKAWQHRDSFRGESSFKAWLYRIAQYHCLNRIRQRGAPLSLDDADNPFTQHAVASALPVADQVIARQMVDAVIARLGEPDRTIFILHYRMEMTSDEISRQLPLEMQLTAEGVRSRLSRKIRVAIEEIKQNFESD